MGINLPLADFAVNYGVFMVIGFLGTLHCFLGGDSRPLRVPELGLLLWPLVPLAYAIFPLFVTRTIFGNTLFASIALRIWQIQPGLHILIMVLGISALPA